MKIVTVIGARPQFVKAAVVSRALAARADVREVIVHTGQHFDANMSDVFFDEMQIPRPDYHLDINGLSHGAMTGQMLEKTEQVLLQEKPDWVLVYGDTNSTLAGALAAKKLHLPIAHVEAGLRSYNLRMPEEINRILTDRMSDLLLCPTEVAVGNLKKEGFDGFDTRIVLSGDVMQDAALFYGQLAREPLGPLPRQFVLATVHRAENTDDPGVLRSLFSALDTIAEKTGMVMPLHPRTKSKLLAAGYALDQSPITFLPPVGYLEMVWLLSHCCMVMTDSGGLQKEAYFFGKFCLTLRTETEWTELVDNGYNLIAGNQGPSILSAFERATAREGKPFTTGLYGNGHAGEIIVKHLLSNA